VKPRVWLDEEDLMTFPVGAASTLTEYVEPRKVPPREFPPGFHVAAPGPSHPEPEPGFVPWRNRNG
jgi:hypothetical protein